MADIYIMIFVVHNSSHFLLSRFPPFPLSRSSIFPFLFSLSLFHPLSFPLLSIFLPNTPSNFHPTSLRFPGMHMLRTQERQPFPCERLENFNHCLEIARHGPRCYQCNREFTNIKNTFSSYTFFWIYYVLRRVELHIYHSVNKYFERKTKQTTNKNAWQIGILLI